MLQIRNLHKSFGRNQVLKGISVDFQDPGIYTVLGPNSSGKSTFIKSILGIVIPDEGEILFEKRSAIGQWDYRHKIGYLPQIARFPENLKVDEFFYLIKDIRGTHSSERNLVHLLGLKPFLNERLGNLSGGTRQKINIVQALMHDSPVLILDEPTAGLDPISLIHFKDLLSELKKQGKLILMTTHIMSLVEELADELVFLFEGKVHFQGDPENMKEIYGASDLERAIANMLKSSQMSLDSDSMKSKKIVNGIGQPIAL